MTRARERCARERRRDRTNYRDARGKVSRSIGGRTSRRPLEAAAAAAAKRVYLAAHKFHCPDPSAAAEAGVLVTRLLRRVFIFPTYGRAHALDL